MYYGRRVAYVGWIEKMQTCNFENEDFLEIDISRGISGAQKLMLRYSSNLAVIVVCEDSVLHEQYI